MSRPPASRSSLGVAVLLFVLLADLGLALWYWHWKQAREQDAAPAAQQHPAVEPLPEAAPAQAQRRGPSASSLPLPVSAGGKEAAGLRPAPKPLPASPAAYAFHTLQRQEQFRKSPMLVRWSRDFLSYPDLFELNRRYWKDRNAVAFAVATLRSPSFARLLKRYSQSPELRVFIQELLRYPEVGVFARGLLEDRRVSDAARKLSLPGLPSVGALMLMGQHAGKASNAASAEERLKSDPELRRYLERQGVPADALQDKPVSIQR